MTMGYEMARYSVGVCEACGDIIYNCDNYVKCATDDGAGGVEHVLVCEWCAEPPDDTYDDFPMSLEYDDDWDHGQYDRDDFDF